MTAACGALHAADGDAARRNAKEERGVKCQFCSNPATVHLTDIVERQKKELHLCQACAEKQQLLKQQELNLSAILQTLIGQHVGPLTDELARLTCPACGIKYMEFHGRGPARLPARLRRLPRRPGAAACSASTAPTGTSARCPGTRAATPARQAELVELRQPTAAGRRGGSLRRGRPPARPAPTEGSHG